MKHIKLRILIISWATSFLLLVSFAVILNIALPKHFEKNAKEALKYEMEYVKSFNISQENENVEAADYVGTFLSGNICFIDLSDSGTTKTSEATDAAANYKASEQNAEKELLDYCDKNKTEFEKIYTLRTDNGFYVYAKYEDYFYIDEGKTPTLMYIDIQPFVEYINTIEKFLVLLFLAVGTRTSVIGLNLGKKIEKSQETQRTFFQNSSHELKTPLMAIEGYAEAIKEGVMEGEPAAEVILQESDRMTHLVEELLSISKIDAKQLSLTLNVTDVREILYDCIRMVEPIDRKRSLKITPMFCEQPVNINCDETQLTKALLNIIVNGIRHCETAVKITCGIVGKDAVIMVEDDGDGLDEKDISHIFDRFYTGRNGNTGIGLALASEIVKLHGGSITAKNGLFGAVFEIRIPLQ